jgi:hypothetical protein
MNEMEIFRLTAHHHSVFTSALMSGIMRDFEPANRRKMIKEIMSN